MRSSSVWRLVVLASCMTSCATRPTVTASNATEERHAMKLTYPKAPKGDVVDTYFGTRVADPFRVLEDPDAPETRAWVEAENRVTFAWLDRIPGREKLKERITELWNYERYGSPWVEGKGASRRMYWWKNDGLQNQAVLYVVDGPTRDAGRERVLLDPNALSPDGTVSLSAMSISDDGNLMAYALSTGGSDWMEWRVKDIATGEDLPDVVKWSKFSGAAWMKDGSGFFYSRYPQPRPGADLEDVNFFQQVWFHRLGDPQEKDRLVVEDKDHKTSGFGATLTEDGAYLLVYVTDGTDPRKRIWVKDLRAQADAPFVKLFDDFDASYAVIGNVGSTFFVQTDLDAPRGRVVTVDVAKHAAGTKPVLTEIIPQHAEDKLEESGMIGGGILVKWLRDAHDVVTFHDRAGRKIRDIELPTIGSSAGFSGKQDDTTTWYTFTSFTYPTVVYELDLTTGTSTVWQRPQVKFDPDAFETKQVFYPSKDGTRIPMFLVHKKGLARNGDNPTYLYAYGGFNISLTPAFSTALIAWLERGGVYAQPSLRGGGEYGEDWHRAGILEKKQNVFDDFYAAAQWLIDEKITSSKRLGIGGGSNGGLLVGAAITQRPELFGAAVPMVGVLDMLRFHKFTIGHAWVNEYGSSDDEKMFPVLLGYSPLHNLKKGTAYPPTMVTTADHDDRVVPAHSFKFAAALQEAQGGDAPVLIRVDVKAGHGAGKPTSKLIDEATDRWAFLLATLGVETVSE
jgi:prolyl oligopeptidase